MLSSNEGNKYLQLIGGRRFQSLYYVELLGISVAGSHLNYPSGKFGLRPYMVKVGPSLTPVTGNLLRTVKANCTKVWIFTLCIVPHDLDFVSVIIGGLAQSDFRFMYNVLGNTMSFCQGGL
ncbi:hypothetical protein IFM89_016987 [Coptis chinensis]|uniref:Uncharacterized protein n=1 Tax=Coptis chinensis TaxID=261450 RepID=A0A835LS19_9MAGN|nr:hypothetical protein IFM89_016987 [Coptis chinensis]